MKHQARKRFGQNFLNNPNIIECIIQAINPQKSDHIIEIGPGQGALTKPLLSSLDKLTAIEIDRDLQAYLKTLPGAQEKLQLIEADVLKVDFSELGQDIRIIGNLPYNISTPLLFHLLPFSSQIKDMFFMLQKEVVDRLAASPGCKDYGRLSIMIQYYFDVLPLFEVPPYNFDPAPKVNSAIVRLIPHSNIQDRERYHQPMKNLCTKAFSMRRKTLANNLKGLLTAEQISSVDINPGTRPEQLSIDDFLRLVKLLVNGV